MKLYTEDQILEFIKFYESANPREYGGYQHPTMDGSELAHNNQTTRNILNAYAESITPIELPTYEEIDDYAMTEAKIKEADSNDTTIGLFAYVGFKIGAKWVIEQIEKQKFGISE